MLNDVERVTVERLMNILSSEVINGKHDLIGRMISPLKTQRYAECRFYFINGSCSFYAFSVNVMHEYNLFLCHLQLGLMQSIF